MCSHSSAAYAGYPMRVFYSMIRLLVLSSNVWAFLSYTSLCPFLCCSGLSSAARLESCSFSWTVNGTLELASKKWYTLMLVKNRHDQVKQIKLGKIGYVCSSTVSEGWGRRINKFKRETRIDWDVSGKRPFLFSYIYIKGCQVRKRKEEKSCCFPKVSLAPAWSYIFNTAEKQIPPDSTAARDGQI